MTSGSPGKLACVVVMALAVLAVAPAAFAQSSGSGNDNSQGNSGENSQRRLNPRTYVIIQNARQLMSANKYAEARKELAKLDIDGLKPFGVSRVELVLANIDNIQQKYSSARRHLQKALASGGLNEKETSSVRMNIAQLYLVEKEWAPAAKALEEWLQHAKHPGSRAYFLLAIAYYRQDKHDKALAPAQKAVRLMETPDASRMRLLLSLYSERKDYEKAVELAKQMVGLWPKNKTYWLMLASFYQANKNSDMALAAVQLAYNAGYLTEDDEYLRLADLLLFNRIPRRCASVLDAALANDTIKPSVESYKKLGNCWIAAREFKKALVPLRRAAQLSDDGNLYVRLAEAQLQSHDWKGAVTAIGNAFDKGDLDDTAHAWYIMGIALFKQHELKKASNWFKRAARDKDYRENATAYLNAISACTAQPDLGWCR
ncbi:MAG: tetratricopeptide repeat protein [Gammaproteobacteria bacterium]|nr:tetratricopeptide repeat protein [Gammaproteobacteria bacterium]